MLTSNPQHHDQTWTVRFVRFSVVIATVLLSATLILVGLYVQGPL